MAADVMEQVIKDILQEIEKAQAKLPKGFEEQNTRNDFIAYINGYIGRAAQGLFRNERENQDFRENMIKAAGLAISAIYAYDKGSI